MDKEEHISFTNEWNNSDQILLVEKKPLHVHRCMLSLWSPVFDRMFNSEFVEKDKRSVTLHGKYYDEIENMLRIMYDRRKEVTDSNFDYLIELSDEFQMDQLRSQCIKYILNADKTGINSIKYLNVARRFHIDDVEKTCLQQVVNMTNETLTTSDEYQHLDDSTKLAIITEKSKHQETMLLQYKTIISPFVEYIYNRVNDGYVHFLREQGLTETIFTRCDQQEKHENKRMGQKFDHNCSLCRKRVTIAKEFTINTKEICDKLEALYELKE